MGTHWRRKTLHDTAYKTLLPLHSCVRKTSIGSIYATL